MCVKGHQFNTKLPGTVCDCGQTELIALDGPLMQRDGTWYTICLPR